MMIFYSHSTALTFWRRCAILKNALRYKPARLKPANTVFPSRDEIIGSCPVPLSDAEKVEVTAGNSSHRKYDKDITFHYARHSAPASAYLQIDKGVAVASPEMTFLQIARGLSLKEATYLATLMCSAFLPVDNDVDIRGFCETEPLTTKQRLSKFLKGVDAFHGVKIARRAVGYCCDNAASPREALLATMLCLPTLEGGYGLPLPLLNAQINIEEESKLLLQRNYVKVDAIWPQARVALEYDSDQWHSGAEKLAYDSKRRNALKAQGYEVTTITNEEIKNLRNLNSAVAGLMKALKLRKRISIDRYDARKKDLHRWLLKQ